jgi:hypothetical protein
MDMSYLLKSNYDPAFIKEVYQLPTISIDDFLKLADRGSTLRIEYGSMPEYTTIAKILKLMADTKVLHDFLVSIKTFFRLASSVLHTKALLPAL